MENSRTEELRTKIAQWERVHAHEVDELKNDTVRFHQAKSKTAIIVAIASIPSLFWIVRWVLWHFSQESAVVQVVLLGFGLLSLFVISAGAARASALLAHFWFRRNNDRERLATIFIALFAATFVFGWVQALLS